MLTQNLCWDCKSIPGEICKVSIQLEHLEVHLISFYNLLAVNSSFSVRMFITHGFTVFVHLPNVHLDFNHLGGGHVPGGGF